MTARQLKSRLAYAKKQTDLWRKRLKIDDKFAIEHTYCPEPDPDDPRTKVVCDDSMAEYWSMTMKWHPIGFEGKDWRQLVSTTVSHEIMHMIMWQWSSFVHNMLDKKYKKELIKLEEQVVQHLEEILYNVSWK